MLKLNIGSGGTSLPGFQNIDRKLGIEAFPLSQYPDGCVEEIRASHILEHFSFRDAEIALKEWFRVLKPGGLIRVAVPDIAKAAALEGQLKAFVLMGGQTDDDDFHRSAYDEQILGSYLNQAGFEDIRYWESDGRDTSSHPASLNLQGTKPLGIKMKPNDPIKLKAVMSVPRLGFNDTWGAIYDALAPLGIPVAGYQGAFWGQCMQRAFTEALDQGVDWILTLDYDSLFSTKQLETLIRQVRENPEIDALAPLQMKRGESTPLHTMKGVTQMELTDHPQRVHTAHFGLTLIKAEALRQVQKPWFQCVPGPSGDYDDDRLDGDIFFWKQWEKCGKTVYVSPNVSIGHLETLVAWFDPNGKAEYMPPKKWRERVKAL